MNFDDMYYKMGAISEFNNLPEGLTYDDVLLMPQYSEIDSRSKIDLSVNLTKNIKLNMPVVPANMKTVTGFEMAKCIADLGGMAIVHRFMPLEEQLEIVNKFVLLSQDGTPYYPDHVGYSIGVKKENYAEVDALVELGAKILCIDIAHGDSKMCVEMTNYISNKYPNVFLISGNVATFGGAFRLFEAGADMVKVGIGPGSLCTTRIETGNGMPQLSAIMMAHWAKQEFEMKSKKKLFLMADGGIKNSGDCVKALCYADMIMAGNLFAGSEETPGKVISIDGKLYKEYVGSSTHKTNHVEGVAAIVALKGFTKDIMQRLNEGIRSGCSYQGASNLIELKQNFKMIKMSGAGLRESHPHDVHIR